MHTNTQVLARYGIADLALEFPEAEVAILTGPQRQGDVFVLPITTKHKGVPIGAGVTVVRSEAGQSNTHSLHGTGLWEIARDTTGLVPGWVTVPAGGEAFLIHTEEHAAVGIAPGTYEIRRQREFAGEWRQVAD